MRVYIEQLMIYIDILKMTRVLLMHIKMLVVAVLISAK